MHAVVTEGRFAREHDPPETRGQRVESYHIMFYDDTEYAWKYMLNSTRFHYRKLLKVASFVFISEILDVPFSLIVPRLSRKRGTLKLIRPSVLLSVRLSVGLSVCHKNFNLAHIF